MTTITKRIAASAVALSLAAAGVLVTQTAAQAHTPSISASCDGVKLNATAYDGKKKNRWHVTINGVAQSGEFGASFSQNFPVPQDGVTTTWTASIAAHDGAYKQEKSGSVGPCGTVPVVTPQIQDYVTCDGATFVLDNTGSNRDVTYVINGTLHVVTAGTAPHLPVDRAAEYVITAADRTWTFAGLAAQSADPAAPCFERPEPPVTPEPKRTEETRDAGSPECGDTTVATVTTWTETTFGWTWNEATKTYDATAASSTGTIDGVRDLEQHELDDLAEACHETPVTPPVTPEGPTTPVVTRDAPTAPQKPVSAPVTPVLASTGTDVLSLSVAGALLALGGLALALMNRRSVKR